MKHYIALADCDCFFVSAERAFNPRLDGRAVAVLSNNDGCVISRSREAKALGLKMGEPYFMAKKRLPQVLYVRANHDLYRSISAKVMAKFKSFTPDVEVCSVDEAYLDLTGTKLLYRQNYIKTAQMIRQAVWDELHIPVSIGLSTTKTLAKLASDKAKNAGGVFAIGSAERNKILAQTLIADVSGVGRKLLLKMREECIFTALDFVMRPDYWVKARFGTHGADLKAELSGIPLFKVEPDDKAPLSIQQTSALREFSSDIAVLKTDLCRHIHTACRKARSEGAKAAAIEVMLRTKDFKVVTARAKLDFASNQETEITPPALRLLTQLFTPAVVWRSTGITLTGLVYGEREQLDLFQLAKKSDDRLGSILDELEEKFGKNIVHLG
ncbi:nucleotidyltransferase/DNA polymerase involved in DNA repair/SOS mutagenesis and repair [Acetobacter sp. CAG:267]|nr:nucleotidyltransferase/DNA polymerase involved in DNA repair/SOS mutagenesis and repair [Acetobacter sp. CAG:267]